jgi:hypothetical protein
VFPEFSAAAAVEKGQSEQDVDLLSLTAAGFLSSILYSGVVSDPAMVNFMSTKQIFSQTLFSMFL